MVRIPGAPIDAWPRVCFDGGGGGGDSASDSGALGGSEGQTSIGSNTSSDTDFGGGDWGGSSDGSGVGQGPAGVGVSIGRTSSTPMSQAELDARADFAFGGFNPGFTDAPAPPGSVALSALSPMEKAGILSIGPLGLLGFRNANVVSAEGLLANTHVSDPAIAFSPTQGIVDAIGLATNTSMGLGLAQRALGLQAKDYGVAAVAHGMGAPGGIAELGSAMDHGGAGGDSRPEASDTSDTGADVGKTIGTTAVAAPIQQPYRFDLNPYAGDYAKYGASPAHQWFSRVPTGGAA